MNTKRQCGHLDKLTFAKLKHILPELEHKRIVREKEAILALIVDRIRCGII
jgi:hypothetical protein